MVMQLRDAAVMHLVFGLMTMTAIRTTTYRELVQQFCHCLEIRRRDDGSTYWAANRESRHWDEEFESVIRQLHDGELPNDWRYGEIARITGDLLDLLQEAELAGDEDACPTDLADEIKSEADPYRSELLAWLEIGERWTSREPSEIEPTGDVYTLVQQLMTQERQWMAQELAWQFESLANERAAS
jgi:hypothetical protein